MARIPFEAWNVEQLRLTIFSPLFAPEQLLAWWKLVAANDPDEVTSQAKRGTHLAKGAWGKGSLVLNLQMDRLDWILGPGPDNDMEAPVSELPSAGTVVDAWPNFYAGMERFLRMVNVSPASRVAFGTVLTHEEDNVKSAYSHLPDYVPVVVDPDSSDFLYQINLPRLDSQSGLPGLQLNRLSKWSVAALRVTTLQFDAVGLGRKSVVGSDSGPLRAALRVEMDVNTVPGPNVLIPADKLPLVFAELVDAAKRIATDGVR